MENENISQTPISIPANEQPIPLTQSPQSNKRLIAIVSLLAIVIIAVVGIGAYVLVAKSQPTPTPQPTPLAAVQPTSTPDPTANWKIYTSTLMGFSFKYPPEYTLPEEQENYLSLISPLNSNTGKGRGLQNGELQIEIVTEGAKENDSPIKCWDDHNSGGGKIISQSEITIGGIKTTNFNWQGSGTGQFICISHDNKRYLINKYPFETTRQTEFDQILSTFKFTDQSPNISNQACGGPLAVEPNQGCPVGYSCGDITTAGGETSGKCLKN